MMDDERTRGQHGKGTRGRHHKRTRRRRNERRCNIQVAQKTTRGQRSGRTTRDIGSGNNVCSDNSNSNSDGGADSGNGDSGDNGDNNSDSGGGNSDSGKKKQSTNTCIRKSGDGGQCSPRLNPSSLLNCATNVQGDAESMILSAHAESICAESSILSASGAKQQ